MRKQFLYKGILPGGILLFLGGFLIFNNQSKPKDRTTLLQEFLAGYQKVIPSQAPHYWLVVTEGSCRYCYKTLINTCKDTAGISDHVSVILSTYAMPNDPLLNGLAQSPKILWDNDRSLIHSPLAIQSHHLITTQNGKIIREEPVKLNNLAEAKKLITYKKDKALTLKSN